MRRCRTDDVTDALAEALRAATPHLIAAAREMCKAGVAFLDALEGRGETEQPVRERIPVERVS